MNDTIDNIMDSIIDRIVDIDKLKSTIKLYYKIIKEFWGSIVFPCIALKN